jgi:hypothetical protein
MNNAIINEFLDTIRADTNISEDIRKKADDLRMLTTPKAFESDLWIYRAVVAVLGITVLATVLGGLYIASQGSAQSYRLPAEIVAIGSAAVGALAALLAPSPREKS